MTKDEAVTCLRRYGRSRMGWNLTPWSPRWKMKNYAFEKNVYEQVLIKEMIRKIRDSDLSPVETVRKFYYFLDDILCESEDGQFITHYFAAVMENCAGELLRYLRECEEQNHDET